MNALARETERREWVEVVTLPAASGRRAVRCHLQTLEVAGGHPGLIVKALGEEKARGAPSPAAAMPAREANAGGEPEARGSKSDRAALDSIAARLSKREGRGGGVPPPRPSAAPGLDREALELGVRELSHELRNPLAVILGFAERIRDSAPPGRAQDRLRGYAADIMESAHLALAILGDFSDRILRPGDIFPKPEPVAISAMVESCLRLIAPLAKSAGIKVSRNTGGRLPLLAAGERVVKQILLNVLMNAVRHQKTGGRIKVKARLRKDGMVRLSVADDGRGMTKKEIRSVLGSGRKKAQPAPGRSGLGLPLVRKLVEAAGGELAIESVRGKGTTVEITFAGVEA
ncbi:HAMP domain-containing sensor histidine kinase [Rhodomicrobium sp. R_RK_3]|nr:HAMP domain-containing sensor histidine kinase [Rhodomicrobium sp. R_RK_3]